jgi:hypothetical protein
VGTRSSASSRSFSSGSTPGSPPVQKPAAAVSVDRSALPSASAKLRPMAIASPTLFMCVVSSGSAPGNFSNANLGTLTTT